MIQPYILMVIAVVNGDVDIQYMELNGQATCDNAKRILAQADTPFGFNVIGVCFPKEIGVRPPPRVERESRRF